VQGNIYFFSKLLNYYPSLNETIDENRILETFDN